MSYFNRMGFNKVIIKLLFFNNNDVNISSFFYFYFRNEFLNLFKSFHTLPANYHIVQPSNNSKRMFNKDLNISENENDQFDQNVDSKSYQKIMKSIDTNANQMRRPTVVLNEANITGTPSALDMNIMKQSGQIRRQIKREDSFDRLTKRISRSLQQSSLA